jgi:hypothetical protein
LLKGDHVVAPGGTLDSVLAAYDGIQLLAFNDDYGDTRDSRVQFEVTAGQTYYVQAAGFDTSTGGYLLSFDTGPGPFPAAQSLNVTEAGSDVSGMITDPGGADVFQFTAPDQGQVSFRLAPAAGSTLDVTLTAFDDTGRSIAFSHDFNGTGTAFVKFDVSQSRTYYVRAGSDGAGTGAYDLQIFFVAGDRKPEPIGSKGGTVGQINPQATGTTASAAKAALVVIPAVPPSMDAGAGQAGGAVGGAGPGDAPRGQVAALGPGSDSSLVLVTTLLVAPGMVTEATGAAARVPGGGAQAGNAQDGALGRATVAVQRGEGKEFSDDLLVPADILELFWQDWGDEEGDAILPALLGMENRGDRFPGVGPLVTAQAESSPAGPEVPGAFPSAGKGALALNGFPEAADWPPAVPGTEKGEPVSGAAAVPLAVVFVAAGAYRPLHRERRPTAATVTAK